MNVLIAMGQPTTSAGALRLPFSVQSDQGHQVAADVLVDAATSPAERTTAIRQAARAALEGTFALTITAQDRLHVLGGDDGSYVTRAPGAAPDWAALRQALVDATTLAAFKAAVLAFLDRVPR